MAGDDSLLAAVSNLSARRCDIATKGRLSMRMPLRIISATLIAFAAPAVTLAHSDRDHDQALDAVGKAEIRPLADILDAVSGKLPGEVVGIEIEHKHGAWYYEFRTVDKTGRMFEVYVDAKTAEIAKIKEK